MKNLLIAMLCMALSPFAIAQSTNVNTTDTFRIQKFPLRYYYAGEKIKRPKKLESILLAKNDTQINKDWKAAKTTRSIGLGVQVLGLGIECAGLYKQLQGNEKGFNIVMGGLGVMLGGLLIQMAANSPTKRAMTRYNGLQTGRIVFPDPTKTDQPQVVPPIVDETEKSEKKAVKTTKKVNENPSGPQIGLRTGLSLSKYWQSGGSEQYKNKNKQYWAHNYPIAATVTLPESGLIFDLALLNKGVRAKTENTTTTSSTKSRTDLQLRYLQLSAMKQLPFGLLTGKLSLYGQGGIFMGYAMNARQKTRSVFEDENQRRITRSFLDLDYGDNNTDLNFARFDLGPMIGAGASYPFGPGRLSFDLRFSVGLLNLQQKEAPKPDLSYPSLRTRDLGLWLGWTTRL